MRKGLTINLISNVKTLNALRQGLTVSLDKMLPVNILLFLYTENRKKRKIHVFDFISNQGPVVQN